MKERTVRGNMSTAFFGRRRRTRECGAGNNLGREAVGPVDQP